MSVRLIHLRKLLTLFYADTSLRTRILREDIRSEIQKAAGRAGEGGDFYGPFWADAKEHMFGMDNLRSLTEARILSNPRRKKLYEACQEGFLSW